MPPAPPCYPLTQPCRRWSTKNNFLAGITLPCWLRLLRRYWRLVEWPLYWRRCAFLTLMSCLNSLLGLVDSLLYGEAIKLQRLHEQPVIILGHPRTGTTLVHNLLGLDPRLAYARTLDAGFPSACLWMSRFAWALAGFCDSTRPMDALPLSLDTPCEDEIAISCVGGVSAYLPIVFMRDRRLFDCLYTFEGAAPGDFATWRDTMLWFFRKVTLRCGGCKPLVIKSPVHTARVRLLLRLFPHARFVYLHRDPLAVFASAGHLADSYYGYCQLQQPGEAETTDFILEQFKLLHQTYVADRPLIPPGQLVEVGFAELDADPLAALRRIYAALSLPDFEEVRPAMQAYVASLQLSGFKKNDHRPLSPELRRRVQREWAPFYRDFGYPLEGEGEEEEAAPSAPPLAPS